MNQRLGLTILGSGGGVAKSVLAILDKAFQDPNDPLHSFIGQMDLHLVDKKQKDKSYYKLFIPHVGFTLHQFDLGNMNRFRQHLADTKTTVVIDVSWADTVEMLQCCDELGVMYINTALENTMVDEREELEGFTLLERYRIFEENRGRFTRVKAIIGSGMNPGVVQWMAISLMKQLPGELPLGCYIVEQDDSFYADPSKAQKKTVYSTWSPECFLDEAILNYPMLMKQHMPMFMYNDVYELEFKVALGGKQFYGCLMPHEEVITLGVAFNMECGFIYRVNEYTTEVIKANLTNANDLWNWKHQVLDPLDGELNGSDLVGVLLVYKDKERYMYNVMSNKEVFAEYKTNATYFQVACGIYGALSTLLLDDIPDGVYFVDELLLRTDSGYGQYLSYYMKHFVTGENDRTDGLLLDRLKKI
ncbi:saccharopine dehydrogenase NADP-binding domain-containing protein [Paenibacillus glycanilyticus]|uniref:saccharopine dehydrogenase NADP-binding domain-containing protein n=1 Tax=Paenibacillus glycanilyticus TaxID=126569 RepID=UPI00203ABC0F|nr:saccharopine dehydrogenase NADP-binding domain-containing protein [Paenibacillus glycanilyticus]MCM3631252.1 saccharopine dehydrogenase NADP-binding domain-containing protein [Paenibacillus glycanilyticus]